MGAGLTREIVLDQRIVSQGINCKAKAMTGLTNRPDHLFIRAKRRGLVVVGHNLVAAFGFGHVAGRAGHAGARGKITGQFRQPPL